MRATAVVAAVLCAATAPASAAQRFRLGVGITSYYTDNILQYSDDQLRVFESGTMPDRFSIKTSDDGVWRPSISLSWETIGPAGRTREVRVRGGAELHQENGTADFRSVKLTWRESIGRDGRLSIGGYYLPSYYLRQLYDDDYVPPYSGLSRYRRAEFGLWIGSAGWRHRLARTLRGEARYQYEHRRYRLNFEERSSSTHEGGFSIERYRLPRRSSVELRAGYRKNIARADDSDGIRNDDPDVSYHGMFVGIAGRTGIHRSQSWRVGADFTYQYSTRDYESVRPGDTSHFGRDDRLHEAEIGVRCELPAEASLRVFYRFEDTAAHFSGNATGPSSDPASYTENQLGLAVEWSVTLWSRGGSADARRMGESP